MTRINLIPPSELTDQHLLAEHREIKRIPNVISSGKYSLEGAPQKYTLGKGHVKFFYNKLKFLYNRYEEIYNECINRGFHVTRYSNSFIYHEGLYNGYKPDDEAISISRRRIQEKLNTKKGFYKMKGVILSNHS